MDWEIGIRWIEKKEHDGLGKRNTVGWEKGTRWIGNKEYDALGERNIVGSGKRNSVNWEQGIRLIGKKEHSGMGKTNAMHWQTENSYFVCSFLKTSQLLTLQKQTEQIDFYSSRMEDSDDGSTKSSSPSVSSSQTNEHGPQRSSLKRKQNEERTPEQKRQDIDSQRKRRSEETQNDRNARNEARRRAANTPEARARRNEYARQRRARATSEERERQNLNRRQRRAELKRRPVNTLRIARNHATNVEENNLGSMDSVCLKCGALHFEAERVQLGHFSSCCENGNVILPPLTAYPEPLLSWLTANDGESKHFREQIRKYNNAFAFASFGYKPPESKTLRKGLPVVVIHGQTYHQTCESLKIDPMKDPSYAQLYIVDPEYANIVRARNSHNTDCRPNVFDRIYSLLSEVNPFAHAFKMMREVMQTTRSEIINMWLIKDRTQDPRRYNLPVANEVAAIFTSEDGEPPSLYQRDICVHPRDATHPSGLQFISTISPNCDPMTYPVLFPYGEPGWQTGKGDEEKLRKTNGSNLTQQDFYAYRLQVRLQFNPILHSGKLTQQFIIDAFLKVEGGRLYFMSQDKSQQQLRVDKYMGLMDFVSTQAEQRQLKAGRVVILPSSFTGSKRNLQQNYQDAMTMVAMFGKPDLFITFTCNPKWKEIQEQLKPGETALDRPDIVATVFRLKLKELLHDINVRHILGQVKGYIFVIEFQKRGLPHVHMLLILEASDKLREIDDFDSVVCAELPDENEDPELHKIVTTCMLHGPCGALKRDAPCMDDKDGTYKCTKDFPKPFCSGTNTNKDGYPEYKRRDNGLTVEKSGAQLDNRWVVPYNPYLCQKYNAHINVEVCSTVKSVKYIFKYVYKGHDAAVVHVNAAGDPDRLDWDEVRQFIDTRYIAAPEAMWRIREYPMHGRSHSVKRLAVHLPFQQTLVFHDGKEQEALERAESKGTTLTAWFDLNSRCPEARQYLYSEIHYHYIFNASAGKWIVRQQNKDKVLSRMYAVSPKDMERYCLRLLLLHIPGARSFEDLRTINGTLCETFQDAAKLLNLLEDDNTWIKAMEEAAIYQMPVQLRILFVTILFHGEPTSAKTLYATFREALMEDFRARYNEDVAEQLSLNDIEKYLLPLGRDCKSYGLPPTRNIEELLNNESVDINCELSNSTRLISMLNEEQLKAFTQIMDSIDGNSDDKCFFLSGIGGSGKTFLYKALISTLLSRKYIVKVVAPTGLASTLLKNGQTVHSGFGIPINLRENSVSKFVYGSKDAKILRATKLIIWDEISMCTATLFDAVDRSLRSLRDRDVPFGGTTIVVGGDFRQQAPVVKHGNRVKVVEACVKSSRIWPKFMELPLKKNMRVVEDQVEFMEWLLKVGSGLNSDNQQSEFLCIPKELISNDIITSVYGGDINALTNDEMSSRSILCPKNEDTLRINEIMLEKLHGDSKAFYSVDTVSNCETEEERAHYPTEFLNSITPMGMPPHRLNLKVGCCVMLLRNLNSKLGLCNGTRLTVQRLGENIIDCTVFSGENKGDRVFIPRICMDTNDSDMPFELRRKQFPLRLAYSMTITKSQGQTFERIGLFLPQPVFTHGQLYTAVSRVKSKNGLAIQFTPGVRQGKIYENSQNEFTVNCVYQELLQ
ncbi:ATP-dependent DNA helicase PIF1 [Orchesella cincta]|uniref:ATP-dependent DNA helicase n=1 Tax=Orchesella cincta TaxID=48709 RepID=A0A1D2M235_ORCCI|nr:ATP-dependent DNA helicase PIF1 [Orchesella cincta]